LLEINNLRLAPDSAPARVEFGAGDIAVLLGRNNSGKTNLLRLIAGLSSRASGEVSIDGEPQGELAPGERPVSFVFQAFVNYPHWSVRQNIESPMRGRHSALSQAQRASRVEEIAATLQLDDFLGRKPGELSGGQQQRLAIGRALASEARVLLLDEPFVNLDFRLRERLTRELGSLLGDTGTIALFASSDSSDAFALADNVVLLADQQLLQSGAPLAVYRRPETLSAADLMSEPAVNWLRRGTNLEVVRPEHLLLAPPVATDSVATFTLRVIDVETNGSHTFVQGRLLKPAGVESSGLWVARLPGLPDVRAESKDESLLTLYVAAQNLLELPHE